MMHRGGRLLGAVLLAWQWCPGTAEHELLNFVAGTTQHAVITQGDAFIGAHAIYRGIAIGGALCDGTPSVKDNVASPCVTSDGNWQTAAANCDSTVSTFPNSRCTCFSSDYGSTSSYSSMNCNMNAPASLTTTGYDTFRFHHAINFGSLPYTWSEFETLANRAAIGYRFSGIFNQWAVDQGGSYSKSTYGTVYNIASFVGANSQGQGTQIVIFKGAGTIVITSASGQQWGPTILAPFAHVVVDGAVGYIDGQIIAKSLGTSGQNTGSVQLHGYGYLGPIIPTCDCENGGAQQDPHFQLAHGGRTDFRGKHNTLYNFLSAQNMSMNIKTENATFKLGNLTVHGSFITEAHVAMRTQEGRHFNLSFWASELTEEGWGLRMVNGSCARPGRAVPFSLTVHRNRRCDNFDAKVDYSSLVVEGDEWTITVKGMPVYGRIAGPHHRLDVSITQRMPDDEMAAPPHGLVGQSFDSQPRPWRLGVFGVDNPRKGRVDVYPSRKVTATFTTEAMAEGAIDGVASDYEMSSPFATAFKYASFGAPTRNQKRGWLQGLKLKWPFGAPQLSSASSSEL